MAVKRFCDKCGKEIKTNEYMTLTTWDLADPKLDYDLCLDCIQALHKWISSSNKDTVKESK